MAARKKFRVPAKQNAAEVVPAFKDVWGYVKLNRVSDE